MLTTEDAYNFFTFNFEPEPPDGSEKKQIKEADGHRDEEGEDTEEQDDADVNEDENEDRVSDKKQNVFAIVFPLNL